MKKTLHILQKLPDTDLFFPLLSYIRGKKLEEKKISLEKNLIVLVKQVPLVLSYCLMSLLYYFICSTSIDPSSTKHPAIAIA